MLRAFFYIYIHTMNVIFSALYYRPEARRRIDNGADPEDFKKPEFVHYKKIGVNIYRVEHFCESQSFPNHTEITTYCGDTYVIKISLSDYTLLIDHIDAGKLICKLKN